MALAHIIADAKARGLSTDQIRRILAPKRPVWKPDKYPGWATCEQCGCWQARRLRRQGEKFALCRTCKDRLEALGVDVKREVA